MEHIVVEYLKELNIPVSSTYCKKLIRSHPDYPSLLSIADTLERLGIGYQATKITKEIVEQLDFPYLLQFNGDQGELKLIMNQKDLPEIDDSERYTRGAVLQVEPTDSITDGNNNEQRSEETFLKATSISLIAAIAGMVAFSSIQVSSWMHVLLLITAIAGSMTGYLLIAKEVGVTYKPVESFCKQGEKTNCDAVLQSEDTQLFGKATLSDAVATYFIFQLLILSLFIPFVENELSFLAVLTVLSAVAIPVIGYSLYYQMIKVKTWCRLCLAVDGVLAVQAALFGGRYFHSSLQSANIQPGVLVTSGFFFIAVGAAVLLIKNKLREAKKATEVEIRASRIKNNPSVFLHLLTQQRQVHIPSDGMDLEIGKSDAPITLLMIGSLGCGPCKVGFEKAMQLVRAYPLKVSLRIRFLLSGAHNGAVTPDQYLLYYWQKKIYGKEDESIRTQKLLQTWYNRMDLERFKREYQITVNGDMQEENHALIDGWQKWFEQVDVNRTPTFFMNGYELPKEYRMEELMGLIPGVVEEIPVSRMGEDMKNSKHTMHK
jgi:protein-disulfide isomerase/uncharacterized membrane protein